MRIRALAAKELAVDPNGLDPNAPLDELGIDSLAFMDFLFKIEEEFRITVTDDALRGIKTLADLERHIARTLAVGKA